MKTRYYSITAGLTLCVMSALIVTVLMAHARTSVTKQEKRPMTENQNSCNTQCGLPESDEELRKRLTPEQYRIVVENGTERPFKNAFWDNKQEGIYVDVVSGEPLFSSLDKFDSGTGWPSFTKPLQPDALTEKKDTTHGMVRTEVRSTQADSHLGHVFPDGPEPTGQRYCINSASLRFIPKDKLKEEGYEEYTELFNTTENAAQETNIATFAAGCFWGVESAFRSIDGVIDAKVGYIGGTKDNPTYKEVCTDATGHAEAVQLVFDPQKVSYKELVEAFWKIHNPTTKNRQGPDVGSQYRSAIFVHSDEQLRIAKESLKQVDASGTFQRPIVTEITEASKFWPAEEYHQRYFEKKGIEPTCHL